MKLTKGNAVFVIWLISLAISLFLVGVTWASGWDDFGDYGPFGCALGMSVLGCPLVAMVVIVFELPLGCFFEPPKSEYEKALEVLREPEVAPSTAKRSVTRFFLKVLFVLIAGVFSLIIACVIVVLSA